MSWVRSRIGAMHWVNVLVLHCVRWTSARKATQFHWDPSSWYSSKLQGVTFHATPFVPPTQIWIDYTGHMFEYMYIVCFFYSIYIYIYNIHSDHQTHRSVLSIPTASQLKSKPVTSDGFSSPVDDLRSRNPDPNDPNDPNQRHMMKWWFSMNHLIHTPEHYNQEIALIEKNSSTFFFWDELPAGCRSRSSWSSC